MATFKLYSDIVGEEEKMCLQSWGLDGHCYKDIDEFLASIPEDDDVIDIRIHCRGGSCIEGWAMYDALRRSKKKIYCTVEGECSSMATIILLAAPLERRTSYKNAHFMIHNPAVMYLDTDYPRRLTADSIDTLTDQMKIQAQALREEQKKILDLYVKRTGANRKELQEIMVLETFITADKAQELGFISKTLAPNTACNNQKINNTIMSKPTGRVEVRKSILDRVLALAGITRIEDVNMRDQVITTADGTEFTVEREDGDPQVGDTAYPDGSYTLDDGTVIVIEDNLITSITPPSEEEETEEESAEVEKTPATTDPDDPNAANADGEGEKYLTERVTELETQVAEQETRIAELESQVADLTADRDGLQAQVDANEGAVVLSTDQSEILAKVEKAGGLDWLLKAMGMSSTFNARNRKFVDHTDHSDVPEGESKTQRAIREQKERYEASKK